MGLYPKIVIGSTFGAETAPVRCVGRADIVFLRILSFICLTRVGSIDIHEPERESRTRALLRGYR